MPRIYYPSARANIAILPRSGSFEEGTGDLLRLLAVKPSSISVERNDLNTADTFKVTFGESVFPIDPRLVRSVSVDLFIGDTGGLDRSLEIRDATNRALIGTVDEIEKDFSNDGADEVTLSGRDHSAFLLDEQWGHRSVELGRPAVDIVADVLETVPSASLLEVVDGYPGKAPTIPAGKGKKRSQYRAKKDATIWEGLSQLVGRTGSVVTVKHDRVVVRPPRSFQTEESAPTFVRGRNLSSLKIKKKYDRTEIPNILVVARDPGTLEIVEGRFPQKAVKSKSVAREGGQPQPVESEKTERISIEHPDPTPAKLRDVARRIRERYSQQQIEVELETKEMRTWELEKNQVTPRRLEVAEESFRVPTLGNGDTVRVFVNRESRTVLRKAVSDAQKARELQRQGFERAVAEELARGWRVVDTPLFVDKASHEISSSGEYSCDLTLINRLTIDDGVMEFTLLGDDK